MHSRDKIGLIAGRGDYPLLFCRKAREAGVNFISVVAFHEETDPEIEKLADHVDWIYVGQIGKAIKSFQKNAVTEIVMAGQIKPGRLFKGLKPDLKAVAILAKLKEKNAESLFGAVCDAFEKAGIFVLPAITYLDDHLAPEGIMGKVKVGRDRQDDIDYGFRIAKEVSRLDIGQTVVVKKGTVLAVEGFEGTDKVILRGGELGRGDVTVVKVSKPKHDMRFDVPCIGMRTVESLIKAGARTLAVETGQTLFIEKEAVLKACNKANICIVGVALQ